MLRPVRLLPLLVVSAVAAACSDSGERGAPAPSGTGAGALPADASPPIDAEGAVVVYSGRSESLVAPVIAGFKERTGFDVKVRYGETAGLAATILEEGDRSPADVYLAQDAGALGEMSDRETLLALPEGVLSKVPPWLRSTRGDWVGVSGRARALAYSTERLKPEDLPASILDLAEPRWKGRIGWAPTNGSFQAFVTALRVRRGEEGAGRWLEGMKANEPREYPKNAPAVAAVASGEIDVALVNHYYLFQFLKERGESFPVRNHFFPAGDAGNLVNVSGAGILRSSKRPAAARALLEFLLGEEAQRHFATETVEYPVAADVPADPRLPPLGKVGHGDLDLNRLADLRGTLDLLRSAGVLK